MSYRMSVLLSAAFFFVSAKGFLMGPRMREHFCANPCPSIPQCPRPHCPTPDCPRPYCPTPSCPSPHCPSIPSCPTPHCPTPYCPTPQCPPPVVNLTCPELHSPPPPPASPEPSCPSRPACSAPRVLVLPSGYEYFPEIGIYKLYSDKKTWLEGNETCSEDGGYLAVPNTKVEMDVLTKIVKKHSEYAHIGFNGFFPNPEFVTSIGDPMDTFQRTLWGPGQPDRSPDKTGVYMNALGVIFNVGNYYKNEFLCEIPLP